MTDTFRSARFVLLLIVCALVLPVLAAETQSASAPTTPTVVTPDNVVVEVSAGDNSSRIGDGSSELQN